MYFSTPKNINNFNLKKMQNIHNQLEKFQDATYCLLNKSTHISDWQKTTSELFHW